MLYTGLRAESAPGSTECLLSQWERTHKSSEGMGTTGRQRTLMWSYCLDHTQQPLPALEDPEVGYGSRAGRCGTQNSTSMDRQGLSRLNSTAPSLDHGSAGAWSWMPLLGGKNQLSLTSSFKPGMMGGISPTAKHACSLHSNLHLQSLQDYNPGASWGSNYGPGVEQLRTLWSAAAYEMHKEQEPSAWSQRWHMPPVKKAPGWLFLVQ